MPRVQYTQEEIDAFHRGEALAEPTDDLDRLIGTAHDMPPEAAKPVVPIAPRKFDKPEAEAQPVAKPSMEDFTFKLQAMRGELAKVLPEQIKVDRFIRTTITAVGMNPDLLAADRQSLFESTMKAAQDGLLCDGREAALVIFNKKESFKPDPTKSYTQDRVVKKVQYMPMVRGLLKVVLQTGLVSSVSAHEVYESDTFKYELGDNEQIIHEPSSIAKGQIIAAYAIFRLRDGGVQREVMLKGDLDKVKNVSKAKEGPWAGWAGEMARKSVLRRGIKYLPSTPALDQLLAHDNELYDLNATPNGDRITPAQSGEDLSRLLDSPAAAIPAKAQP